MSVRMYHPQHGYHVLSYGDDEAVFVRHGWVREEVEPTKAELPAEEPSEPPKRRGRPRKEQ